MSHISLEYDLVDVCNVGSGDGEDGEEDTEEDVQQHLGKGEKSHLIVWQVTIPY